MLKNNKIDDTAIISETVELGENIEVGPYTIIEGEVEVGDNTKIGANCHIQGWTKIGEDNIINNYSEQFLQFDFADDSPKSVFHSIFYESLDELNNFVPY